MTGMYDSVPGDGSDGAGLGIDFSRILYAHGELTKWEARYEHFKYYLSTLPPELRRERKKELKKIKNHIHYYRSLLKEMRLSVRGSPALNILRKFH